MFRYGSRLCLNHRHTDCWEQQESADGCMVQSQWTACREKYQGHNNKPGTQIREQIDCTSPDKSKDNTIRAIYCYPHLSKASEGSLSWRDGDDCLYIKQYLTAKILQNSNYFFIFVRWWLYTSKSRWWTLLYQTVCCKVTKPAAHAAL